MRTLNPFAQTIPPCPPLPRPPRHDGPIRVSPLLDLKDTMSPIYGQMFVNAPADEPFPVSFRRLVEAIRSDGRDFISPTSVFIAYRRHPELACPVGTPPCEIVRDPAPRFYPTP